MVASQSKQAEQVTTGANGKSRKRKFTFLLSEQSLAIIRAFAIRKRRMGKRASDAVELESILAEAGRRANLTKEELMEAWRDRTYVRTE